jgi:hypothetical protein
MPTRTIPARTYNAARLPIQVLDIVVDMSSTGTSTNPGKQTVLLIGVGLMGGDLLYVRFVQATVGWSG